MMNELVRRMARTGLSNARSTRGIICRVAGVQAGHLGSMSSEGPSKPSWLLSAVQPQQRLHFSTDGKIPADVKEELESSDDTSFKVVTDPESGKKFGMLLDTRKLPKLKPSIVKRRLDKCKTYVGTEKNIRQSPWKLNRICQLAAGLTLEEALTQLRFCPLKNADLVAKVLKRTSNLADIRDGIQMSQLEVAECFTTKAMMLRRIKIMGRGRHGIMHHKFSHIRVVLREIDFPLRIFQQKSLNQKRKWLMHQQRAEQDAQVAKAKRQEMQRLMKQQEEQEQERKIAAKK